ncbi:hypothetical protein IWX48DRAFT_292501 [Phyllosticta citricarpa]
MGGAGCVCCCLSVCVGVVGSVVLRFGGRREAQACTVRYVPRSRTSLPRHPRRRASCWLWTLSTPSRRPFRASRPSGAKE